jgi:hypothetical protein
MGKTGKKTASERTKERLHGAEASLRGSGKKHEKNWEEGRKEGGDGKKQGGERTKEYSITKYIRISFT